MFSLGDTSCLTTPGCPPDAAVLENVYNNLATNPDANRILVEFSQREDMYMYCESLIDLTANMNIKFLIYRVVEDFVANRWLGVDEEIRAVLRDFIFRHYEHVVKTMAPSMPVTKKVEEILVSLIIIEFPEVNPEIISSVLGLANNSLAIENVVQTLEFLMERLFGENAEDKVKYHRINIVTSALLECAEPIFQLIVHVFENESGKVNIQKNTLLLLRYFIKFIPPQLIIEGNILQRVVQNMIPNPNLISEALVFLSEVYEIQGLPEEICGVAGEVFQISIDALSVGIPEEADFAALNAEDTFKVKAFTCFIITFLDKQHERIEIEALAAHLVKAVQWVIQLTTIDDYIIKKICIDFWFQVARRAWTEKTDPTPAIAQIYVPAFAQLRRLIIPTMVKPEEILVNIVDGEVTRDRGQDAQAIDLFKSQKALLVMLTNIDNDDMFEAFGEFFTTLQSNFDFELFNSVCYASGAITGTLGQEKEKEFMVNVSQILLAVNAEAQGDTETRAVVAGGLMYVYSQYPRFVASSYPFFRSIIEKLTEFMHSEVDSVREMAVNSFGLISEKTAVQFHYTSGKQPVPLITEIIQKFDETVCDLGVDDWIIKFVGYLSRIIGQLKNEQLKKEHLTQLMTNFNQRWNQLLAEFNAADVEFTNSLIFVLKVNAVVARYLKGTYGGQLGAIFSQMIEVYQRYAVCINEYLPSVTNLERDEALNAYKEVKSSIVEILKEYISKTPNVHANSQTLLPPILETIVTDYETSDPNARIPELLDLITILSQNMKNEMSTIIPGIFQAVFGPTVEMIKDDYETYLNFRLPFYRFMHMIVKNHTHIMLSAPQEDFQYFVNAINWGVSHPFHDVCVEAIETTVDLIKATKSNSQFTNNYIMMIIGHLLGILTDTLHKSAFREQADLLRLIFVNNRTVGVDAMVGILMENFPNGDPEDFGDHIGRLMALAHDSTNTAEFNQTLRSLLIATKQFSVKDQQIDIEGGEEQQAQFQQDLEGVEGLDGPAAPDDVVYTE